MAVRVDYIARETTQNLLRNASLTLATVLTVAISLSFFGAALLVQQGVGRLNTRFKDDVEFVVLLNTDVTSAEVQAIAETLRNDPDVVKASYVDIDRTYAQFTDFYKEDPEILNLVKKEQVPTSFLVTPRLVDVTLIRSISDRVGPLEGVSEVRFASDDIKNVVSFSKGSSRVMFVAAGLAAVAAAMLMYNTIRTAVFARRREIEVMRLVGATKSFIRIPFMLEGLAQGVAGALIGVFGVLSLNRALDSFFTDLDLVTFRDVALPSGQILAIGGGLILIGAFLGGAGAGIAVTRYLDA